MATVTGLTAARMQQIIDAQMATADIVGNDLIITTNDGHAINAGHARGAAGAPGSITGFGACCYQKLVGIPTTVGAPTIQAVLPIALDTPLFTPSAGYSLNGDGKVVLANAGIYHFSGKALFGGNPTGVTGFFTAEVQIDGTVQIVGQQGRLEAGDSALFAGEITSSVFSGDFVVSDGSIISLEYAYTIGHNLLDAVMSIHRVA